MRHITTREMKARAEEFESEYDTVMITELTKQITDYLDGLEVDDVDSENIEEIVVNWKDALPDIGDWCFDQVDNEIADIGDAEYDAFKDEQMMGDRI